MALTQTRPVTPVTYTKLRDGSWGLRGAGLVSGQHVTVTKKSGETKTETVGRILWTGDGVALATIAGGERRAYSSSYRSSGRSYGRSGHVCRACGHDEDTCADLDCTCRTCGGMMR